MSVPQGHAYSQPSNITVYTVITDEKDSFIEEQNMGKADFVAFMDKVPTKLERASQMHGWKISKSYDRFKDPRRNSRIQKILAHQYVHSEYSIYIDGNISLLISPEEMVVKYLKDKDLAVWKHTKRDCLFDEAIACAKRNLDDPEVIIEQAKTYEDGGFSKHKGLSECGVIIRRHTKKTEAFNNAWWSEYCRHSCRDQISFMYAIDKAGLRFNSIDDPWVMLEGKNMAMRSSGAFTISPHNKINYANLPHTHE